ETAARTPAGARRGQPAGSSASSSGWLQRYSRTSAPQGSASHRHRISTAPRSPTTELERRDRAAWCRPSASRAWSVAEIGGGCTGGGRLLAHLGRDPVRLGQQRLDDVRLGDGPDDLALDEDLALAVAGGDAEIGLAGLARAVDDASHHGHAQRDLEMLEPLG